MRWMQRAKFLTDCVINIGTRTDITYVSESANWAISGIGRSIAREMRGGGYSARVTTHPLFVRSGVVHFGSFKTRFFRNTTYRLNPSLHNVWTVQHVIPELEQYDQLQRLSREMDAIHVPSTPTRDVLEAYSVPVDMIKVLPLGVDVEFYSTGDRSSRSELRRRYSIPDRNIILGSFQKDGTGWGDGMNPKREKGPDVFVNTVQRLSREVPVTVLLVGPARGYVARALETIGVHYIQTGYVGRHELPFLYSALDLYIISSRIEGGPLSLLESWASQVPVVGTNVGMISDIGVAGENMMISTVDDAPMLAELSLKVLDDYALRKKLIRNARRDVLQYDWSVLCKRYADELYELPL